MSHSLVLKNARIIDPSRDLDEIGTLIVRNGRILAAGRDAQNQGAPEGAEIRDCDGLVAVPGLVATFLITLIFSWNEYLIALILTSANARTMPLLVAAQDATRGPQWWAMSVLVLIMILPVIVMAIVLERFISRGILIGAVKG